MEGLMVRKGALASTHPMPRVRRLVRMREGMKTLRTSAERKLLFMALDLRMLSRVCSGCLKRNSLQTDRSTKIRGKKTWPQLNHSTEPGLFT